MKNYSSIAFIYYEILRNTEGTLFSHIYLVDNSLFLDDQHISLLPRLQIICFFFHLLIYISIFINFTFCKSLFVEISIVTQFVMNAVLFKCTYVIHNPISGVNENRVPSVMMQYLKIQESIYIMM